MKALLLLLAMVFASAAFARPYNPPLDAACEEIVAGYEPGRTPNLEPEDERDVEDNIDWVPEADKDDTPLNHDPMYPPEQDDELLN